MRNRQNLIMTILGVVAILGGVSALGSAVPTAIGFFRVMLTLGLKPVTLVLAIVTAVVTVIVAALFVWLGVRLLLKRPHMAARMCHATAAFAVVQALGYVVLRGIDLSFIGILVEAAILVALSTYLDPDLAEERRAEREMERRVKRADREVHEKALTAKPAHGYVTLNFFNLFWIFVVCSVFGLIIETVYHMTIYDPGVYQDRAGLLFGPFSPIYGFGGVLLTIALNRFYDKAWWIVFLVSAVIGGAFEYFVSWLMQFAFGIQAWDYTGTFLSIGGRTNFMFMCFWGILGLFWIKLLLPRLLKLIRAIPWNWRYSLTTVCAVLMLVDCVMTVQALDCWYMRESGRPVVTATQKFYEAHFDNQYMADRFQSMAMDTDTATRI